VCVCVRERESEREMRKTAVLGMIGNIQWKKRTIAKHLCVELECQVVRSLINQL